MTKVDVALTVIVIASLLVAVSAASFYIGYSISFQRGYENALNDIQRSLNANGYVVTWHRNIDGSYTFKILQQQYRGVSLFAP